MPWRSSASRCHGRVECHLFGARRSLFASGNWRAAYERLLQAKETSDRLLNNQLDQRFATLKVEFDTAAKDKENALLMHENEINQQALAQGRSLRRLQAAVIVLSVTLVLVLAMLAVYQRTPRAAHEVSRVDG